MISPEHDGQLRAEPVLSLTIRCRACAGLNVAGRGLRMWILRLLRYDCSGRQASDRHPNRRSGIDSPTLAK